MCDVFIDRLPSGLASSSSADGSVDDDDVITFTQCASSTHHQTLIRQDNTQVWHLDHTRLHSHCQQQASMMVLTFVWMQRSMRFNPTQSMPIQVAIEICVSCRALSSSSLIRTNVVLLTALRVTANNAMRDVAHDSMIHVSQMHSYMCQRTLDVDDDRMIPSLASLYTQASIIVHVSTQTHKQTGVAITSQYHHSSSSSSFGFDRVLLVVAAADDAVISCSWCVVSVARVMHARTLIHIPCTLDAHSRSIESS